MSYHRRGGNLGQGEDQWFFFNIITHGFVKIHGERSRVNNPGFAVFQGAPVVFSAAVIFAGWTKLLFYVDDTAFKIIPFRYPDKD